MTLSRSKVGMPRDYLQTRRSRLEVMVERTWLFWRLQMGSTTLICRTGHRIDICRMGKKTLIHGYTSRLWFIADVVIAFVVDLEKKIST